jgi:hypothetical protein
MGSDRTTICGISDLYFLAKIKDRDFNLSSFVRDALEYYVYGEEIKDPRKEAARKAAEVLLSERQKQKKIIEEEVSYEEKARELVKSRIQTFNREAQAFFRKPSLFKSKLPEYDTHGDYIFTWNEVADKLSDRCGFPVTSDECISFVRKAGEA